MKTSCPPWPSTWSRKITGSFGSWGKKRVSHGHCESNREGAIHSSLHSTLSVLEGILEYRQNGYTYRLAELLEAKENAQEFILMHHVFRSDKTGNIINQNFLKFCYPCRWHYDILKTVDYFKMAGVDYDPRMADALSVVLEKKRKKAHRGWPQNIRVKLIVKWSKPANQASGIPCGLCGF